MDGPLFGYHPNLAGPPMPNMEQHMGEQTQHDVDMYGAIDNAPKCVAGVVLASLLAIVALKALGFRFSFGVAAGR